MSNSSSHEAKAALLAALGAEAGGGVSPPAQAMAEAVCQRHRDAALAIVYYGSCLRRLGRADETEGLLDFYLIVDRYRRAYGSWLPSLANRLLAPNVYYAEGSWSGGPLRAKYAVISLAQFRAMLARDRFEAMGWARFAQPVRLLCVRDDATRRDLIAALGEAVIGFMARAAALAPSRASIAEIWTAGFRATYRCELRAEAQDRAETVVAWAPARYETMGRLALQALGGVEVARAGVTWRWALRRLWGRALHLLRLAKAVFTFAGGVDYILWKIERHSGVRPSISAWERRHPILAAPILLVRFYRAGAFR